MAMWGVTDRQSAPAHGVAPDLRLSWVWRRRNRLAAARSHVLIALCERFSSDEGANFAERMLSAMRKQSGGHDDTKKGKR
jgi:hypothetical protein